MRRSSVRGLQVDLRLRSGAHRGLDLLSNSKVDARLRAELARWLRA